ncbi:MAG: polyphenol oxidase family protein, partial [Giesbergeria sp.]
MVNPTHCHSAAQAQASAGWLQPDWPAPTCVHALCTTRAGGVSTGAFASMNLGTHVGDSREAVDRNRMCLQAALQAVTPGARAVFLDQVHGCNVVSITADASDGHRADAALTVQPGVACTIMVADCLPVLITDRQGRMVAAAHAGWRGLAGGVLESVLQHFKALRQVSYANAAMKSEASNADATPIELLAWLG